MSIFVRKNQNWSEMNTLDGASKGETIIVISISDTSGSDQEYDYVLLDDEPLSPEQEARIAKIKKDIEDDNLAEFESLS